MRRVFRGSLKPPGYLPFLSWEHVLTMRAENDHDSSSLQMDLNIYSPINKESMKVNFHWVHGNEFERIQDILPQNMGPWYMEHLKLKEFEKMAEEGRSF